MCILRMKVDNIGLNALMSCETSWVQSFQILEEMQRFDVKAQMLPPKKSVSWNWKNMKRFEVKFFAFCLFIWFWLNHIPHMFLNLFSGRLQSFTYIYHFRTAVLIFQSQQMGWLQGIIFAFLRCLRPSGRRDQFCIEDGGLCKGFILENGDGIHGNDATLEDWCLVWKHWVFCSQNSIISITSWKKGRTGFLVEENSLVAFKRGKFAVCWMLIDFRFPLIFVGTLVPEENRLTYIHEPQFLIMIW